MEFEQWWHKQHIDNLMQNNSQNNVQNNIQQVSNSENVSNIDSHSIKSIPTSTKHISDSINQDIAAFYRIKNEMIKRENTILFNSKPL